MNKFIVKAKGKLVGLGSGLKRNHSFLFQMLVMALAVMGTYAPDVFAWTAPQSGSFAYDVYDIAINQIAKGPIGFVAGSGLMAGAIFMGIRNAWVPAIAMGIGSGLLFKLDALAQSLGYII